MMDSLAYRDDAATVLRRLIRSLPTRRGVLGIATCDKGLPAMMMALAAQKSLPCVIVPGGVTLLPEQGEDAGKIQSLGARFAHGLKHSKKPPILDVVPVHRLEAVVNFLEPQQPVKLWQRRWDYLSHTLRWHRRVKPFGSIWQNDPHEH